MATKRKPKRPAGRTRRPATGKASAPRRPKRRQPETFRARALTPALTVSNLQQSIAWYEGVLGFTVADRWEAENTLRGVELKAGATSLYLSQDDWAKGRDRLKGEGMRLRFTTAQDIDRFAAQITSRGGGLDQEPRTMPWGERTFTLSDPDGYRLTIAQLKR
ncbi:MAG: VOC family protein [Gemmatimonadales bacterium]